MPSTAITNLMPDIPRSTGNTFILYTNNLETPDVIQAPSFSAITGIKSVSGGLDNENVTIQWKNGSWFFACKKTSVLGRYSFEVSVSSVGSDTRESTTVTFTFQVILLHGDDNFDYFFFKYRVGDKVNKTIEQRTANTVLSYGIHGQLYSPDENRYGSGLYLALVDESGDGFQIPKLMGIATRPGIYIAAIHCATDDSLDGFSGGTDMIAPVIVSIIDKNYADNQLMVVANNDTASNQNILRLIYCKDDLFRNKGGWFSVQMSGGNGTWVGRYEEQAQSAIIVTEYQIKLDGKFWSLLRREYTMGEEDSLPEWERVSNVAKIPNSELPPSYGWSNGAVISGDTRYLVDEYGLYDYKGEKDGEPFFQQQVTHTRQYKGWNTPAEYTNNQGYILIRKEIDKEYKWVLLAADFETIIKQDFEPKTFIGVVVPYAPPTREKYAERTVRDLAFENINIHNSVREVEMLNNGIAGSFWDYPDERRNLVPYNGTSGDNDYYISDISVSVKKYSFYERGTKAENTFSEGIGEYWKGNSYTKRQQGVKLDWDIPRQKLKYSRRDGDAFGWVMGVDFPQKAWEHTWEGEHRESSIVGDYWGNVKDGYTLRTTSESNGKYIKGKEDVWQSDLPTRFTFYIAGGADYTSGKWHNIWAISRWLGGAVNLSATDKELITINTIYYASETEPQTDTQTYEYQHSINIGFNPNFLLRIPHLVKIDEDLSIEPQTVINEESKFTATIEQLQAFGDLNDENEWVLSGVNIRLYYDLTITFKRSYTAINGKDVIDSLFVQMTKVEKKAGVYSSYPPNITTIVTYEVANGQPKITTEIDDRVNQKQTKNEEFLEYGVLADRMNKETKKAMDEAKDDVESCELKATNTAEDRANGQWSYSGTKEELAITNKKE